MAHSSSKNSSLTVYILAAKGTGLTLAQERVLKWIKIIFGGQLRAIWSPMLRETPNLTLIKPY